MEILFPLWNAETPFGATDVFVVVVVVDDEYRDYRAHPIPARN